MQRDHTLWGTQHHWRVIDQSDMSFSALDSFAIDDTLCAAVGAGTSPAAIRLWVHRDTVVLGTQDSRLPNIDEAIHRLHQKGYQTVVRNSGGMAVVLDSGVLNLSLVLPVKDIFSGIDDGYEKMVALVQEMLAPFGVQVETGEIKGSYCPGRFDLSIGQRKFGGISQRRVKGGMAAQVFLIANGSGSARARLIQEMYRVAAKSRESFDELCVIRPETMVSLSERLGKPITIDLLKSRLYHVLHTGAEGVGTSLLPDEMAVLRVNRARMIDRNERFSVLY